MTGKGFRAAVKEFNQFIQDAPGIGDSTPDPVMPNERIIKVLVYDRKNRKFTRVPPEGAKQ